MNPAEIRALEARFFAAFERGDAAAIADCYGPDMRVWNNLFQTDVTGAEHIAGLQAQFFRLYSDRKFIDVRTDPIEGGFVRQHVVTGRLNGEPVSIPMCIVCRVRDGKMVRLDEYLSMPPAT